MRFSGGTGPMVLIHMPPKGKLAAIYERIRKYSTKHDDGRGDLLPSMNESENTVQNTTTAGGRYVLRDMVAVVLRKRADYNLRLNLRQ